MNDATEVLQGASLLVNTSGAGWTVPATTAWNNEAMLRDLLVSNPTIVPGVSDPAAAAVCEFSVPGIGRIDVVVVESTGAITVVEAKLAANPEIKRKIVGQVFAYAAGLAEFDLERFEAGWHNSSGADLARSVLGTDASGEDIERFSTAVAETLRDGSFRIVLAVDRLTTELRSTVTYLADHTDLDVAALELAYASSGGVEILVPKVWGLELSSDRRSSDHRPGAKGYRATVSEHLDLLAAQAESRAPGFGAVVHEVIAALAPSIAYLYSGSAEVLDPVLVAANEPQRQPAKVITTQRTIGVRVCFHWCQRLDRSRLDKALLVLEADARIAPIVSGVREADYRRGPLLPFEGVLDQLESRQAALRALEILFA